MNKKKILITGGCGFIGTNLFRYLLDKTDWNIVVLDNLSNGIKENILGIDDSRLEFVNGDIRNEKDVSNAINGCNYVVNLAAQVGVIPSIKNPFFDMDINIYGLLNLLNASVKNNVEKFVQASSAAPLGDQDMPLDENKVPAPLSPYGASKLAGEGYCCAFSNSFNLKTIVLRFSNVYGPWCGNKNSVIPLFIKQILNGEDIIIYGDGNQTRDFVYVEDICQGIYLGLTMELKEYHNLFQLGTSEETSINHLVDLLKNIISKDVLKEHKKERKGEIFRNYTSIEKAKDVLSYKPQITIDRGLEKTINWFVQQWE